MKDKLEDFINVWSKEEKDDKHFVDFHIIEKATRGRSKSVSSNLKRVININIGLGLFILILTIFNIFGYQSNTNIMNILGGVLITTFLSIFLLLRGKVNLLNIEKYTGSLQDVIVQKINFYMKYFQWILYTIPILVVFLPLNVNMLVDNNSGELNINNPWMNLVIYGLAYIISLIFYKRIYGIYLKELKAALQDLAENTLTKLEKEQKQNRWFQIVGIILFTLIILIGIVILFFYN